MRNHAGFWLLRRLSAPIRRRINTFRRRQGLPPHRRPLDFSSSLAQLSQLPAELDFPRAGLPDCFHYTGPLRAPIEAAVVPFPDQRLTDDPLVYASLGTLQNQLPNVFEVIAEACVDLGVQLLITRGHRDAEPLPKPLPGDPLVVDFAPQRRLLQRTAVTITHAGLNTTLDSLAAGVPMVAIPITNDQPGVAARIAWVGAGEVVSLARLTAARLRGAVQRVLRHASYRERAATLRSAIESSGGVAAAAEIVVRALQTRQPVRR